MTMHLTLVITGGIAAYKMPDVIRQLRRRDVDVQVVLTHSAEEFVTRTTLEVVSGHPVITADAPPMTHIEATRHADLLLVAPATANIMAKAAQGIADDLVSSLLLARRVPCVMAPAMNQFMWHNPATQRNVKTLLEDGIRLWGPIAGNQACGDVGEGRFIDTDDLVDLVVGFRATQPLLGQKVVITAGPTVELIDAVRAVTNLSSGAQGYAFAKVCRDWGADVTLVSGPTSLKAPYGVKTIHVMSAQQMLDAVREATATPADLFCGVAAVADFRMQSVTHKIKKGHDTLPVTWLENPDILKTVVQEKRARKTLGFAAETNDDAILDYARDKLQRKGVDAIVANHFGRAHKATTNAVTLVRHDREPLALTGLKDDIARQVLGALFDETPRP